jgi:hypothetical protein
MTEQTQMTEQDAAYLVRKSRNDQRDARRTKLKSMIAELVAERAKIAALVPAAQCLVDRWSGDLARLKGEFVRALIIRAGEGKTPFIRFDDPGALAYVLSDLWVDALPRLAEEVSGSRGISRDDRVTQYQIIDSELMELRAEYAALGGL